MDIKPSEKMKLKILQSGEDHLDFITKVPANDLLSQDTTGMKKYEAVCKSCGEVLCRFYSPQKGLERAIRLEGVSRVDMERWYGLRGVNISPNSDVNFECNCGSAKIYEPTTNRKRYAEYNIILGENG